VIEERESMKTIEIQAILDACDSRQHAADVLGVDRTTLFRWLDPTDTAYKPGLKWDANNAKLRRGIARVVEIVNGLSATYNMPIPEILEAVGRACDGSK
jgi:hypothetical protein